MRPCFQWWSGKYLLSEEINKMLDDYKFIMYQYVSVGNGITLNQCFQSVAEYGWVLVSVENTLSFTVVCDCAHQLQTADHGVWDHQKCLHCSLGAAAYSNTWRKRIWSFALGSGRGIRKGMLMEHNMISKEKESCNFCIVLRWECCLAKCLASLASAKTKLQVSSRCHRPLQVNV